MAILLKVRFLKGLLLVVALAAAALLYRYWPDARTPQASFLPGSPAAPQAQPKPLSPGSDHDLKVLEMALQKNPGHTPVLMQMANLESSKGRYQDAERHLQEILRREPDNAEARLELGRVMFQLGDVQGAIEQTESILKKQPSNSDALYNLGAIYGNLGNKERAAVYWQRLISVDPQSASGKLAQQMMSRLQTQAKVR